jgi:predicted amidophosphoribosyltransferase
MANGVPEFRGEPKNVVIETTTEIREKMKRLKEMEVKHGNHDQSTHGRGGGGGGTHDVKLPKNPKKLNIDTAAEALSQMGFEMGMLPYNISSMQAEYSLTDRDGNSTTVSAREAKDMIYAAAGKGRLLLLHKAKAENDNDEEEKCPKCKETVVPDKDDRCPECGADLYDFAKGKQDTREPPEVVTDPGDEDEEDDGKKEGRMVCPECEYVGPGKAGKCPECGAKLTPKKDFVLEKLGRVLSKANESKLRDAIEDVEEVRKMDISRPAKALLSQAKRGLSDVVASLGTDEGTEKEWNVKEAMAIVLAKGEKEDLRMMSTLLKTFEKRENVERLTKQFVEFVNR